MKWKVSVHVIIICFEVQHSAVSYKYSYVSILLQQAAKKAYHHVFKVFKNYM